MPVESQLFDPVSLTNGMEGVWFVVGALLIVLAVIYFIFSLIVVRQVNLMTETLITEVAPYLRALAIIHAGFALSVIILFIGVLL